MHHTIKDAKAEGVTSTAAAAQFVMEHPDLPIGAIANELAAKEYGLVVAKPDIHDFEYNRTRFIFLSKQPLDLSTDIPNFIGLKQPSWLHCLLIVQEHFIKCYPHLLGEI